MSVLAVLALALVAVLLGAAAARLAAGSAGGGLAAGLAAGLATSHAVLYGLSVVGLRWSPPLLAAGAFLLLAAGRRGVREILTPSGPRPGWGDWIALVALGILAWYALELKIVLADFAYHWGVKGEKFFLARGVDWSYLGSASSYRIHPDYPTLVPELYALTALLLGRFAEPAMMAWSVIFALALVVAGRRAMASAGASRQAVQVASAVLGLLIAAYALRHGLVGGADWLPALALLVALPVLGEPPDPVGDWTVGVAAALAAAAKIEGVPLAALLVAVHLAPRLRRWRLGYGALLRCAGPLACVALPWLLVTWHRHLFLGSNSGSLTAEKVSAVGVTLFESLGLAGGGVGWHGLPLLLLGLPWLLLRRRARPLAFVLFLQAAFFVYAWASESADTVNLVRWSEERLFFQLLPALVVLLLREVLVPEVSSPVAPETR